MFTTSSRSLPFFLWLAFAVVVVALMDLPLWVGALLVMLAVGAPLLIARRFSRPGDESLSEQIQRALR